MRVEVVWLSLFAIVATPAAAGPLPGWIQEGVDQGKHQGGLALTQGMWLSLTTGYANDIACEAAGAAPPGRVADWLTRWSAIFQGLTRQRADGSYATERPDLYLNYIVRERRKAGLPDFPESFAAAIPPSPPHAKTPDWIDHPTFLTHTYGPARGPICMPPVKTR